MKTLAQWLSRTCCCRHPDAEECSRLRIAPGCRGERCECCCHDRDEDEDRVAELGL